MATKQQPQPENNVAQPEAAAPAMPVANYQAYPHMQRMLIQIRASQSC